MPRAVLGAPATGGGCQGEDAELLTRPVGTDENAKMTDCYFEKKDWRACTAEASLSLTASTLSISEADTAGGEQYEDERQWTDSVADGTIQTVLESAQQRREDSEQGRLRQSSIVRYDA